MKPWHVLISFKQFDEDGDNTDSGTFEELWVSPKKYRQTYKSDKLNQTDFSTDKGLFRTGDQRWPDRTEMQVKEELLTPFLTLQSVPDVRLIESERNFGTHTLRCNRLDVDPGQMNVPREFCFDPTTGDLRYVHGASWFQTAYNSTTSFQDRRVAREVDVTDAGKPHLVLKVIALDQPSTVDDALFMPPTDAVKLGGEVTGVAVRATHTALPEWPSSARGQHFKVVVEIVIGTDGRVETAKAIDGPPQFFKTAENTAKKWTFEPYLIQGEAVKVRTKIELSQN